MQNGNAREKILTRRDVITKDASTLPLWKVDPLDWIEKISVKIQFFYVEFYSASPIPKFGSVWPLEVMPRWREAWDAQLRWTNFTCSSIYLWWPPEVKRSRISEWGLHDKILHKKLNFYRYFLIQSRGFTFHNDRVEASFVKKWGFRF
jgi:hypothetical protein